jgi:hypothetical protein
MRLLFSMILAAMLAACASPGELLEREPQLSFETKKPADVFSTCVADAFSRTVGNVSYIPTPAGYRVVLPHPSAGADAVVEVTKTTGGAKVRYVERMPSLTAAWLQEAVLGCK